MKILDQIAVLVKAAVATAISERVQELEAEIESLHERMDAVCHLAQSTNNVVQSVQGFVDEIAVNRRMISENRELISKLITLYNATPDDHTGAIAELFTFSTKKDTTGKPN